MTSAPVADSRSARKAATRDAIADALLDLLAEGNLRPTAREISQRAGTSLRSVYVHFDDLEDLYCVAAKRHFNRLAPMLEPVPATGPLPARTARFVRQRVDLFAAMRGVARATQLQAPFSPTLERLVRDAQKRSRREVDRVFATELDAFDTDERRRRSAVLDSLLSSHAWETLRVGHELSTDDAERATIDAIMTLLEPGA